MNNHSFRQTRGFDSRISPVLANVVYPFGQYLLLPFYFDSIKITGQENLPKNGPVILAPTHRSRWDALILGRVAGRLVLGRDLRFMVSKDEVKGLQGFLIRHLGGFSVDPLHPKVETLRFSVDLLCQGEMLIIFPEGDIYRTPQVKPLKRGLASIALQAQAQIPHTPIKIIPVSIRYSQPYPRRGCRVWVDIGKAIEVTTYHQNSPKKASLQLTADLEKSLKGLHEYPKSSMIHKRVLSLLA